MFSLAVLQNLEKHVNTFRQAENLDAPESFT